MINYLKIRKYR